MNLVEYETPRVGVGVIVRRGSQVLMGLREGSHGAGTWALPGGHVEPGETPCESAARELEEEHGIRVSPEKLREAGHWTTDLFPEVNKHYVTLYVIWDWDGQEPQICEPNKCQAIQWAEWSDLPEPGFTGLDEIRSRVPDIGQL